MNIKAEGYIEVKTECFGHSKIVQDTTAVLNDVRGNTTRQIINLQEEQIRETLIYLGWTPPKEVK